MQTLKDPDKVQKSVPITASADAIRACKLTNSFVRNLPGGAAWNIVAVEPGYGYAISERTNQIVSFEQTGTKILNGMVRCRITAATDPGGPDDTIVFDGEHWAGWMPARFALDAR